MVLFVIYLFNYSSSKSTSSCWMWHLTLNWNHWISRSSHPEVFLRKGVLKICSKFTGEHPYRSVISVNLQSNFIEITLRHGCSAVNLLHIFRTASLNNTSGWLPLEFIAIQQLQKHSSFLIVCVLISGTI